LLSKRTRRFSHNLRTSCKKNFNKFSCI
jgi:hypothetical protein